MLLTAEKIAKRFQNKIQTSRKTATNRALFTSSASFQGEDDTPKDNKSSSFFKESKRQGKSPRPQRITCPCGSSSTTHYIDSCWYVRPATSREGWSGRAETRRPLKDALDSDPNLLAEFKKLRGSPTRRSERVRQQSTTGR